MKKTKIFYGNQYKGSFYTGKTKWQSFKLSVKKWFLRISLCAALVGAFYVGGMTNPTHYIQGETIDSLPAKIESLKDQVVEEIAQKESDNAQTSDGLVVIDDNKAKSLPKKDKLSYGCMQMKISTVQFFSKKLYNQDISNHDAIILALDCEKAKALSKDIVFKVQGGLFNWSVADKEMKVRVELIKKLEQN